MKDKRFNWWYYIKTVCSLNSTANYYHMLIWTIKNMERNSFTVNAIVRYSDIPKIIKSNKDTGDGDSKSELEIVFSLPYWFICLINFVGGNCYHWGHCRLGYILSVFYRVHFFKSALLLFWKWFQTNVYYESFWLCGLTLYWNWLALCLNL